MAVKKSQKVSKPRTRRAPPAAGASTSQPTPAQDESDDELEYDKTAYRMYHRFQANHPCLSFDTLTDDGGDKREDYPAEAFIVCGTQATRARDNAIVTLKLANMHPIKQEKEDDDDDDDSSESDSDDEENTARRAHKAPVFRAASIPHHGGINRVRACRLSPTACVVAVWNGDAAKVQLWSLATSLRKLNDPQKTANETTLKDEKPLHSFAHAREGYALAWSPCKQGALASGDGKGRMHLWSMHEGGTWTVEAQPLEQHTSSVEDIQWSPTEEAMLASVSVDKTIRLWDTRAAPKQANVCTLPDAHDSDINVLDWNALDAKLLITGGDDHHIRIWDVRRFTRVDSVPHARDLAVATFKHHTEPITSVHWNPHDSTVFAASGEDNQTSIWDIAVEREEDTDAKMEEGDESKPAVDTPQQLLFAHMGQKEVKEVRWHPQLVGTLVTTAKAGFDIFRTISV